MTEDLRNVDPQVWQAIENERRREAENINLIASENFAPLPILQAQGSLLTNKYAEGYPQVRYYGGCQNVDKIENLAIERVKKLFGCEHANVQPHSGSQANMAVYFSQLKVGDAVLGMHMRSGGHLTHGSQANFSGKLFTIYKYGLNKKTDTIDFNQVEDLAKKHRPKLIIAGYSAYPRQVDFSTFGQIAKKVGAYLMADIAHIAGLIAANLHPSPIPHSEFVTATTHKTLRGPRGGFIMCKKRFAPSIDAIIFPGIQGGPLMHIIAAKAVALKLAQSEKFKEYQKRILTNAQTLAFCLQDLGYRIVSGGTDTHLILVDLRPQGITGQEAEELLEKVNICVNKNGIPEDPLPPRVTSGIRLGTPSITTQGMGKEEIKLIASFIDKAIASRRKENELNSLKQEVKELCQKFLPY